jgi:hypothetical protein
MGLQPQQAHYAMLVPWELPRILGTFQKLGRQA